MTDDLAYDLLTSLYKAGSGSTHPRWIITRTRGGRESQVISTCGVTHRVVWNVTRRQWIRACDDGFSNDQEIANRQVDCMACVASKEETP